MVFIVAEIGVNWDGDFDLAREMISNAKKVGCDAVKFQAYETKLVQDHPERDRLTKAAISKDNIEKINDLAKSVGIEWFCTPMYLEAVDLLNPFVKRFKLREIDGRQLTKNEKSDLFNRMYETGKEIIISSQTSPRSSKFFNDPKIKWLYCVPKYPCDLSELDFSNMEDFDGFSNHTPKIIAPLIATILGAKILEIHVTLDKSKNFIDNIVSLDYNELRDLIDLIHLSEKVKTRKV